MSCQHISAAIVRGRLCVPRPQGLHESFQSDLDTREGVPREVHIELVCERGTCGKGECTCGLLPQGENKHSACYREEYKIQYEGFMPEERQKEH